jgi:GMP synthase (glutamine-hydrolysing)
MSLSAEADLFTALGQGVDGVILSGSPREAWNGSPINLKLCEVVHACQERAIPFLGICYGHQLLGRALGGIVGPHLGGLELGNTLVKLTMAGKNSPLFADFPDQFEVLSSHTDAVLELPPQCELLVQGDFTPIQGFHWNQQLFGVQFHPETDPEILRFIWHPRRETWRQKVAFDLDTTLDNLRPTPMAGAILRNFVMHLVP